jgi:type IV secretion system protein VirB1
VHVSTLSALVRQESGGNPFAIGINGGTARLTRQPRNRNEAIATAEWLRREGHNFDAGLGQINVKNMGWLGLSVAELFDPCANLRAAATVLGDCYQRASRARGGGQAALRAALSCYNTGNFSRGFANGYVAKVTGKAGLAAPPVVAGAASSTAETKTTGAPQRAPDRGRGDVFGSARRDAFSPVSEDAPGAVELAAKVVAPASE